MAENDKKSSIVNIIIMVLILVINVVVVFFVSKIVIKKSIETVVAEQSAILQKQLQAQATIKPTSSNKTDSGEDYSDEESSSSEDDLLKNYNSAEYENFPMEEIYANIDGRYLVVTLNLKYSKEEKKLGELLKTIQPDIRAEVLSLLRRESIENLEDVNYERELQKKIKKRINKLLPEGKIAYVMFIQYLLQ